MKEDCLFGLEHLFCALAGNGDENEMFLIHIDRIYKIKKQLKQLPLESTSSSGEGICCKDNSGQLGCQLMSIRG